MVPVANSPEEAVEEVAEAAEEVPAGLALPGKPSSNIFTLLLLISLVFVLISIYLVCYELNTFYDVTFGGLLSKPAPVESVIPE